MSQPVASNPYIHLNTTALGTQNLVNNSGNFNSYIVGTATTGTVTFYDAGGTAQIGTATYITTYTGAVRDSNVNLKLKRGLSVIVSGTIDAIVAAG